MRRTKIQKMGYRLKINRTGEDGAAHWESVGELFKSRHQARLFKDRYHPTVKRSTITGVRVNTQTLPEQMGKAFDADTKEVRKVA